MTGQFEKSNIYLNAAMHVPLLWCFDSAQAVIIAWMYRINMVNCLCRNLCDRVVPGNRVTVIGIYSIKKTSKPSVSIFGNLHPEFG